MYGKLIDGSIQYAPRKITEGSAIIYNPTGAQLEALGYKPIEVEPQPEVPEGYHLEVVWSETESAIIKDWEIVKDPDDIDDTEALAIMLGEEQ